MYDLICVCSCVSANWLARFEHSADVTRMLLLREPLPPSVVDLAFEREKAATETRRIKLEVVRSDIPKFSVGNLHGIPVPNPPEHLLSDDASQVKMLI